MVVGIRATTKTHTVRTTAAAVEAIKVQIAAISTRAAEDIMAEEDSTMVVAAGEVATKVAVDHVIKTIRAIGSIRIRTTSTMEVTIPRTWAAVPRDPTR